MPEIRSLPLNGHCGSNADIAKHLRQTADDIEGGDLVRNVVVLIEYEDGELVRNVCGHPIDLARVAGLMAIALNRVSQGDI